MQGFREVQIMEILTTNFWKFPLMQLLLGEWLVAEVLALYAVIGLGIHLPLEIYIFFFFLGMQGEVVLLE